MKDQQIIEKIEKGQVQSAFRKLYAHFKPIKKYIVQHGGDREDALDLFQDALIVFYEKVKSKQYRPDAKISTYLFSICKYQWMKESKSKGRNVEFKDIAPAEDEEDFRMRESRFQQLQVLVLSLGAKCRKILYAFYYQSLSMAAIADKLGYASVNSAKTQKFKCLERVRAKAVSLKGLEA